MDEIAIIKVVHYLGLILWLSGIFMVINSIRIRESNPKIVDSGALSESMKRAYKMYMNPGMMTVWTAGLILLYLNGIGWLKTNHWMHLKLLLIVVLTVYHLVLKKLVYGDDEYYNKLSVPLRKVIRYGAFWLLLAVIILAVFKTNIDYVFFAATVILYILITWFVYGRRV